MFNCALNYRHINLRSNTAVVNIAIASLRTLHIPQRVQLTCQPTNSHSAEALACARKNFRVPTPN